MKSCSAKRHTPQKSTIFPSGRIGSILRQRGYTKRVSKSSGVYLASVVSYLVGELLESAAKCSKKSSRISPRALYTSSQQDPDLGVLLKDVTMSRGGAMSHQPKPPLTKMKSKSSGRSGYHVAKKPTGAAAASSHWEATLTFIGEEDPEEVDEVSVTLRATGTTEDAAKAAVAEALHKHVFEQPISSTETENLNDYDSPLSFLESIRTEHEGGGMPDSMAASLIWDALYEALQTLTTVRLRV